jgi:hydrogenase expression/formation protein HypC
MCLGVPAQIIAIDHQTATVKIGDVEYQASLALLENSSVGDFVIIHAGFAIEKVSQEEAEETLRLIREIGDN